MADLLGVIAELEAELAKLTHTAQPATVRREVHREAVSQAQAELLEQRQERSRLERELVIVTRQRPGRMRGTGAVWEEEAGAGAGAAADETEGESLAATTNRIIAAKQRLAVTG